MTFFLFELDFNVKFPLLRLLQYLSDFKSTIFFSTELFFLFSKLLNLGI